ncbi:TonB-dependent siderophore receptor [Sphingopyxis sp. JAI128]|uniref:TonB-dependent siderophore receptor n=1 Tax=Sphingopyxis sp. JAI128 TaxID=2723066 RepID=UPI00161AD19E|nr:TonB-dependent receptor [Sphingopyxis sp. JAI128]MBB6426896.1 iron complex outermembrane receptor protein [Sphingopyxis sp. JAI128]
MSNLSLRAATALLLPIPLATLAPAHAQRVDENAVSDAEDAFGSNIGGETLGIYSPSEVRGFSPTDAGNVRIEGLYIDRQTELTSRLVAGNRIRIGPSALGYAFPAPSGVADYRLRAAGDDLVLSTAAKVTSFGGWEVEADALVPLDGRRLGLAAGAGFYSNAFQYGNSNKVTSIAASLAWRPGSQTEIKPFWSRIQVDDEESYPIVIGNGRELPERMSRRRFLGQDWADYEVERITYGAVGRTQQGSLVLRAGAFRSANIADEGHTVLLDAAAPGMLAARSVIASPRRSNASTSGEISLARPFAIGRSRHELRLSVRARRQARYYGGSDRVDIGPAPFDEALPVARPGFNFSERTSDQVRQWTAGLAYQGLLAGVGQLNLGIQRTGYEKAVTVPDGVLPVSRARPWLFNAAAAFEITPSLALYGGMTRGLEESDVAPETAVNRDEAPPAIRTRQFDGGLRWRLGGMTLIAGAFDIRKPYYGLDTANVFRRLGSVNHRGAEVSLSGSPADGLTLVAGGMLLDATIAGTEVAAGAIGQRPIGTPSRTLAANVDYRLPAVPSLSVDVALQHAGRRYADAANDVRVPSRTLVDVGIRYRFRVAKLPAVVRLQATNLFDVYGWDVEGNNAFAYIQSRRLTARLVVDM